MEHNFQEKIIEGKVRPPCASSRFRKMFLTAAAGGLLMISPVSSIAVPSAHAAAEQRMEQAKSNNDVQIPTANPFETNKKLRKVGQKIAKRVAARYAKASKSGGSYHLESELLKEIVSTVGERVKYSTEKGGEYGCRRAFEVWEEKKGDCNELSYLVIALHNESSALLKGMFPFHHFSIKSCVPAATAMFSKWDHVVVAVFSDSRLNGLLPSLRFKYDQEFRKNAMEWSGLSDDGNVVMTLIETTHPDDPFGYPYEDFNKEDSLDVVGTFLGDAKSGTAILKLQSESERLTKSIKPSSNDTQILGKIMVRKLAVFMLRVANSRIEEALDEFIAAVKVAKPMIEGKDLKLAGETLKEISASWVIALKYISDIRMGSSWDSVSGGLWKYDRLTEQDRLEEIGDLDSLSKYVDILRDDADVKRYLEKRRSFFKYREKRYKHISDSLLNAGGFLEFLYNDQIKRLEAAIPTISDPQEKKQLLENLDSFKTIVSVLQMSTAQLDKDEKKKGSEE